MAITGAVPTVIPPTSQLNKALYTSDTHLAAGTVTSDAISGLNMFGAADLTLKATIAGTSTLNVYIQRQLPDGSWTDIVSFTQLSATGVRYIQWADAAMTADASVSDAALPAAQIKAGLLGDAIRIKGVVAGAAPDVQFTVYGSFYRRKH